MKKQKSKILLFLVCFCIFFSNFSIASKAFASDDTELNWYFVARVKGQTPEAPQDSSSFLKELGGYYVGDTSNKVLYLTFDEGYENGNTPRILDVLKETNTPAAFFVVEPYIDSEPEIVKRMVDEGHLVCNHSHHHPSMAQVHDDAKFKAEFGDVETAFKNLTGKEMPKFFRPPMGKYSKNCLKKTQNLGYKTIFWSFAYRDWLVNDQPDEQKAIEKITKGAHPGAIMLLHAVSDTNTKVLKTVIETLKAEGYEFKTLNDLPN